MRGRQAELCPQPPSIPTLHTRPPGRAMWLHAHQRPADGQPYVCTNPPLAIISRDIKPTSRVGGYKMATCNPSYPPTTTTWVREWDHVDRHTPCHTVPLTHQQTLSQGGEEGGDSGRGSEDGQTIGRLPLPRHLSCSALLSRRPPACPAPSPFAISRHLMHPAATDARPPMHPAHPPMCPRRGPTRHVTRLRPCHMTCQRTHNDFTSLTMPPSMFACLLLFMCSHHCIRHNVYYSYITVT